MAGPVILIVPILQKSGGEVVQQIAITGRLLVRGVLYIWALLLLGWDTLDIVPRLVALPSVLSSALRTKQNVMFGNREINEIFAKDFSFKKLS